MSPESFEKIGDYLKQKCSCFKDVAQFDENGKLKREDSKDGPARDVGQSGSSSSGQFLSHA